MVINQNSTKKSVKFSIAFSNIPVHSKIFTEQPFVSEDFALKELIKECPPLPHKSFRVAQRASAKKIKNSAFKAGASLSLSTMKLQSVLLQPKK